MTRPSLRAGLAAWSGWLAERSGVDRLLIATPIGCRDGPFVPLIGPVMNTVALHIDVADAANYGALVRQVRDKTRAAVVHRDAPLERVLERLRPSRPARALANTGFLRQRTTLPETIALPTEQIPIDRPGAQTDAALELDSRGGLWSVALRYSADVFSEAAAAHALDDFITYLREVTTAPEAGRRKGAMVSLTPTQVRMWADQQRAPEAPLYNVASAVDIEGHVDPAILAGAFAEVVSATDALRFGIVLTAHGPELIETSRPLPPLEVADAGTMSDDEYRAWLDAAVRRPFDLRGPLYRSFLIRRGAASTWLLVQHHLITDGWSVRLLCDRVSEAYVRRLRLAEVEASAPEPLPVPQWTPLLRAAAAQNRRRTRGLVAKRIRPGGSSTAVRHVAAQADNGSHALPCAVRREDRLGRTPVPGGRGRWRWSARVCGERRRRRRTASSTHRRVSYSTRGRRPPAPLAG